MRKSVMLSAVVCCAICLLLLAGCSAGEEKKSDYTEIMNGRLVSFTDCVNDFCDTLDEMAGSESAPSDRQIAALSDRLDRLEKACDGLAGLQAPAEYASAQSALNEAVADYRAAFEKCRALLEFFRTYDEQYHAFGSPDEGRAEIEKKERALFDEFAQAMKKATDSFRAACGDFENATKEE